MREVIQPKESFSKRLSIKLDDYISILSPKTAMNRKAFRFSYEILDKHRLRKKRSNLGGTGDNHLTETRHDSLREICRDLSRNNPLVKGIFRKLSTKVVGTSTKVQSITDDDGWNKEAGYLWENEMVNQPCEVTGRFNIHTYLKLLYHSYCQDGDIFTLFTRDGIQPIESELCGTPYGMDKKPKNYRIVNGIAISNKTNRVIGYYIGKSSKWGYIQNDSYKKYEASFVHHSFSPDRFSYSRGEPILVSAVDAIDKLFGYVDAELVAAKINACFPMMVTTKTGSGNPVPFTGGVHSSGKDEYNRSVQKVDPGLIWEGRQGEDIKAIGSTRPAQAFDPFMMRILMIIGNPVNMPLMIMTGDYSGATFMNSRVAYSEARDTWNDEQELLIKPFVRTLYLYKLKEWIARKKLSERIDWNRFNVSCKRWPYVDPFKEAKADEQQLKNGTTTRTQICQRQGYDFNAITEEREKEEKLLTEKNISLSPEKKSQPKFDDSVIVTN